jgi:hypothetical protein
MAKRHDRRGLGGRFIRELPAEGEPLELFRDLASVRDERFLQPVTDWHYVESSRVKAARYDPNTKKLCVRFIKLGDRLGLAYVYDEVPQFMFEQFLSSSSLGRYINTDLNKFPYHPADEDELQKYFDGERYS